MAHPFDIRIRGAGAVGRTAARLPARAGGNSAAAARSLAHGPMQHGLDMDGLQPPFTRAGAPLRFLRRHGMHALDRRPSLKGVA